MKALTASYLSTCSYIEKQKYIQDSAWLIIIGTIGFKKLKSILMELLIIGNIDNINFICI